MGNVVLHNFMPRSILDSDDEGDAWSCGDGSSSSGNSSISSEPGIGYQHMKDLREPDFCLFQDYFGLSNLLSNVKISEDNPLLFSNQRNMGIMPQFHMRRGSWSSDASDSNAVVSPTIDTSLDTNFPIPSMGDLKQLPPPSMRLSKAMRDHIISGAYQQHMNTRTADKIVQPTVSPPIPPSPIPASPPRSQVPQPPVSMANPTIPPTLPQRQQPSSALQVCVFCRNNGESESVYTSHVLKDADGRTACPILRAYTCPICKANGDNSHTIKYCPMNQNARAGVMGQQPNPNFNNNQNHSNNMAHQQQRNQPAMHQRMNNFRAPFPNLPRMNVQAGKLKPYKEF